MTLIVVIFQMYSGFVRECTLNNCESLPCWFDLASAYAEITDKKAENTLDFWKNPRFKRKYGRDKFKI